MITPASVAMEQFHCWECGVLFAVPSYWAREKFKNDEHIHCPNGHEFHCVWKDREDAKELKEENDRLRRELMQAKHDHDQAEARLRDERTNGSKSEPLVEVADGAAPPAYAGEVTRLKPAPGGRVFCPHCDNTYKSIGSLRTHLRDVHDDDDTADKLMRLVAAMEK